MPKISETVMKNRIVALVIFLSCLLTMQQSLVLADAKSVGDRGIEAFRQGNLIESMQLLEHSANGGYVPAQVTYAYILDISERDEEAVKWYLEAAESNDPAGIFGLGGMYAKGEGVERDPQKAGQWTRQAAEMEHVPAMRTYAYALENGSLGFAQNPTAAAEWFLKAAQAGDDVAMRRLKNAYDEGQLRLPIDPEQASFWEEKINPQN
jgi:TPR repeat protein